jgi:hypothetical protein
VSKRHYWFHLNVELDDQQLELLRNRQPGGRIDPDPANWDLAQLLRAHEEEIALEADLELFAEWDVDPVARCLTPLK